MGTEEVNGGTSAAETTTTTETVVIVRPRKVIGMLLVVFALLLMVLSLATTAWIEANRIREGLWELCRFRENEKDMVDCEVSPTRDWVKACQALFILAMTLTFVGVVLVSMALRGDDPQRKYRHYIVGVVFWFTAAIFQVIALIIYPAKFADEISKKEAAQWQFGWSYGLSWAVVVCIGVGGAIILIDRKAVEVEEREVIMKEGLEEGEGIEVV